MSIQRGLPHLFHFEIVGGFAPTAAPVPEEDTPKAANDVADVLPLRGEAQAVRVLFQWPPDEAC